MSACSSTSIESSQSMFFPVQSQPKMQSSLSSVWYWVALALLLIGLQGPSAYAQDEDAEESVDLKELVDILKAQDERIQDLEDQLKQQEEHPPWKQLPVPTPIAPVERDLKKEAERAERLRRLEESVTKLEGFQTRFNDTSPSPYPRKVSGRIHIDHWQFPDTSPGTNIIESGDPANPPNDRLLYRRIRLGVQGSLSRVNMSYQLDLEFSDEDGSQFRDAWLGWDNLYFFDTIRVGNQKRPYGLDHLNSSNFNVFLERPFITEALNQDNRRFGVVSYGASPDEQFNWRYGVYVMERIQDRGSTTSDDLPLEFAARLANTWWYDECSGGRAYGHLGIAGTFAAPQTSSFADDPESFRVDFKTHPEARSQNRWVDTGAIDRTDRYQIIALESVFNAGRFQATGEYMSTFLQRENFNGQDLHFHGAYVYCSYFLTHDFHPWNRHLGILGRVEPNQPFFAISDCDRKFQSGWGAWEVALRLSYSDFNDKDVLGGVGENATLGLNWYWNSRARLQLNYVYGNVYDRRARLIDTTQVVVSGDYKILGVRFNLDF